MTSRAVLDRLTSHRDKSSVLPLRSPARRSPSEYTLDDLEPQPRKPSVHQRAAGTRLRQPAPPATTVMRPSPPSSWDGRTNSFSSSSKGKAKAIFPGPPPPIASSRLLGHASSKHLDQSSHRGSAVNGLRNTAGSFFDLRQQEITHRPDSVWRGIQRQEKSLEHEIQQFLDLQASGLVAGSGAMGSRSPNDPDGLSEADSNTAFSTFYSTTSSPSHMVNSLHVPMRSTAAGDVIPVRQPTATKPLGLRSARNGLRRSMAAMAELKAEENMHVEAAIAQRKEALEYLKKMSTKRDNIYAELHTLEEDQQEPLGQELRELGSEKDSLDLEIQALEEKLVGMRNRRRWLRDKMDDVKNRREAGLSGYRAAGRDIDAEVQSLMRRPPVVPLDLDVLDHHENGHVETPGGLEFLRLRPERRTAEMARSWWQGEVDILERRKRQIVIDREALEDGAQIWEEVIKLVADFESSLRGAVKAGAGLEVDVDSDSIPSEAPIHQHLSKMDAVIAELEQRIHLSEEKHWNLLICAIGAELEAFMEARSMLRSTLGISVDHKVPSPTSPDRMSEKEMDGDLTSDQHHDESDNEVPPDLLVSHLEDPEDHGDSVSLKHDSNTLERRASENNPVPLEFLTENGQDKQ